MKNGLRNLLLNDLVFTEIFEVVLNRNKFIFSCLSKFSYKKKIFIFISKWDLRLILMA